MATKAKASASLFTRKATGLVREARTIDALFYNVMWASVALSFAFVWLFYAFYPGANLWVALGVAACMGIPGAFLYAMLSQIMPRTGGDYVFNSRSLSPSVGFAANFSFCFWLAIIFGLYTTYMAAYGFGAMGRMFAGFTGSSGWLSFGDWFSTEWGLFITGTVALIVSALIFIVGGLRVFLRIQVVVFALYALGTFLVPVIVGLAQSKAGFLANFNDYAVNLGTDNAVAQLTASGKAGGFAPLDGYDTKITLQSTTLFWYVFGFL
jgi:amino acid transporter